MYRRRRTGRNRRSRSGVRAAGPSRRRGAPVARRPRRAHASASEAAGGGPARVRYIQIVFSQEGPDPDGRLFQVWGRFEGLRGGFHPDRVGQPRPGDVRGAGSAGRRPLRDQPHLVSAAASTTASERPSRASRGGSSSRSCSSASRRCASSPSVRSTRAGWCFGASNPCSSPPFPRSPGARVHPGGRDPDGGVGTVHTLRAGPPDRIAEPRLDALRSHG